MFSPISSGHHFDGWNALFKLPVLTYATLDHGAVVGSMSGPTCMFELHVVISTQNGSSLFVNFFNLGQVSPPILKCYQLDYTFLNSIILSLLQVLRKFRLTPPFHGSHTFSLRGIKQLL